MSEKLQELKNNLREALRNNDELSKRIVEWLDPEIVSMCNDLPSAKEIYREGDSLMGIKQDDRKTLEIGLD